jgi:4-hydroxy-tetrahydrodipicolinate reductase
MGIQVGLLGYGKMGKAIDQLAQAHGVEICWRIGSTQVHELDQALLQQADVVIEFTRPEVGFENVIKCLEAGVPVVSGTTGWQSQLPEAKEICLKKGGAFLWASNFSIGVNLFFAINEYVASLMEQRPEYHPKVTEIHHIHKLDAPSGTAVTLAEGIFRSSSRYQNWELGETAAAPTLPISAIREGEVPGTHLVHWQSTVDEITLEHKAHSRMGFAIGAITAAKWIVGKKGVFNMRDVLL